VSRGFTASAFNTREFFHGKTPATLQTVKYGFLLAAFVVPFVLLVLGLSLPQAQGPAPGLAALLAVAFLVQYAGLLAERWFFFTEAQHPQNLYYQRAA